MSLQYNELVGNAYNPDNNTYSAAIFGPAPRKFFPAGNIVALDVLNAAFDAAPKTVYAVALSHHV